MQAEHSPIFLSSVASKHHLQCSKCRVALVSPQAAAADDSCSAVRINGPSRHLLSAGSAASLGCVRMKVSVSRRTFEMTSTRELTKRSRPKRFALTTPLAASRKAQGLQLYKGTLLGLWR